MNSCDKKVERVSLNLSVHWLTQWSEKWAKEPEKDSTIFVGDLSQLNSYKYYSVLITTFGDLNGRIVLFSKSHVIYEDDLFFGLCTPCFVFLESNK